VVQYFDEGILQAPAKHTYQNIEPSNPQLVPGPAAHVGRQVQTGFPGDLLTDKFLLELPTNTNACANKHRHAHTHTHAHAQIHTDTHNTLTHTCAHTQTLTRARTHANITCIRCARDGLCQIFSVARDAPTLVIFPFRILVLQCIMIRPDMSSGQLKRKAHKWQNLLYRSLGTIITKQSGTQIMEGNTPQAHLPTHL
jgi:hypothetical protein